MKFVTLLIAGLMSFAAQADVGDKYSIFAKSNRADMTTGLVEITGATFLVNGYVDGVTTVLKPVKAALDLSALFMAGDSLVLNFVGEARQSKFTVGVVYDPDDVVATTDCLGLDFEVADVTQLATTPVTKTCFKVVPKKIIIK